MGTNPAQNTALGLPTYSPPSSGAPAIQSGPGITSSPRSSTTTTSSGGSSGGGGGGGGSGSAPTQAQLDAAKGIVRDAQGNIIHDASAIINETARAEDIARIQAGAGETGTAGAAIVSQAQKNIGAANTLLDSINLKLQGKLPFTGGETYAELLRAKQTLETARQAESQTTGVSASYGVSPQRQAYLEAVGRYQAAILAQPTQEVLSRTGQTKTYSLAELQKQAKEADIAYISQTFGYPRPIVEANYESGLNFKANLGSQSYSNLLKAALVEFEKTGKAYVPGLDVTLSKVSTASEPIDLSQMQSRMSQEDIIKNYERLGYKFIGGQSTAEGEMLLFNKPETMSRFTLVSEPPEFSDVPGNFASLASQFKGFSSYATGDFPLSQRNIESTLKNATFGPRGLNFRPFKGILELGEEFTSRIEGQMDKPEVVAEARKNSSSLTGNPIVARQTVLDLAAGTSKIPKAITGFPEFILVTGGGLFEGYFLGLEGAVTGNFQPLQQRGESAVRTLTNPSFIAQTGAQLLVLHTLPKIISEKPVTDVRIEVYKPKDVLKVETGQADVSKVRSVGMVEDQVVKVFSTIEEGRITAEKPTLKFSEQSTDLVKATKQTQPGARPGEVIIGTTYTGKVAGAIYGKLGPSYIESVADTIYKFEQGLIKRPTTELAGSLAQPEVPLGVFTATFKTTEFNKPIILASENFGTVTSTSLSSIGGRLDILQESFPYTFRLTEFGKTETLSPAFASAVQNAKLLLEGRTDLSASPELAALIELGKKQQGTFFTPEIPKDVEVTSTLTEGTITQNLPKYPFDIFKSNKPEPVLAKGFSLNLLKAETRAGEATLSYGESFNLADALKRNAAEKPYGEGPLADLGKTGKATPSLSLVFNRLGQSKISFKELYDILTDNEPKYPREFGAGAPVKRGYNAGFGGGLELKGEAELKLVEGKPKVKLLPPKAEGGLGSAPNIDLAEQFRLILTKKGYTVVPKESGGQAALKTAVIFQEKTQAKPSAISKSESGLFREVQSKGGMVQLQKVKPLESKVSVKQPSKQKAATKQPAKPSEAGITGKQKSLSRVVEETKAVSGTKPSPPRLIEKAREFSKPRLLPLSSTGSGAHSQPIEKQGEKVEEKQRTAQFVGLKQPTGQLTGQKVGEKQGQRTRLVQSTPAKTPSPRITPATPTPPTIRIRIPRKPPGPPGEGNKLSQEKKKGGKMLLRPLRGATGARGVYADYLYAGRSQSLYGKATSPSPARKAAQAGIRSYFARVPTVEQLKHGKNANALKLGNPKGGLRL